MSTNYTTYSICLMTLPALLSKSSITSAELQNYITRAEAVVNGKLATRYTVPFSPQTVPILEVYATDLALYYCLRRTFSQDRKNESEWVRAYKDDMAALDLIAKGAMTLVNSAGAVITQRTDLADVWSNTQGYNPTMTEDDPEYQTADPDKLDDTRSDRNQIVDDYPL